MLDPIVALRRAVRARARADGSRRPSRPASPRRATRSLDLVDKYREPAPFERAVDAAPGRTARCSCASSASSADEAQLYERLADRVLLRRPVAAAAPPSVLARNRRGAVGLWGYGISGDLPIVLLRIDEAEDLELVRQLLRAHAYWRLKGLAVDLVI